MSRQRLYLSDRGERFARHHSPLFQIYVISCHPPHSNFPLARHELADGFAIVFIAHIYPYPIDISTETTMSSAEEVCTVHSNHIPHNC